MTAVAVGACVDRGIGRGCGAVKLTAAYLGRARARHCEGEAFRSKPPPCLRHGETDGFLNNNSLE